MPGSPFQSVHFVALGYLLRGANGFPFRGRNHSDEIAFHDHLRVGKAGFVQFTDGHERGAERLGMHHARVQHAGQPHIGGPLLARRDFGRDDAVLKGLADNRVFADRLHGRVARDRQSHDAGQAAGHRDGELQLLALHQVAVRHALAAARNDAVLRGKLALGNAQPFGGQIQQRLIGVGGRFADVRRSAAQKIECAAAVRRAVGVAHHHGGDGLERRVQLFGHNLPVGRERCALAEIALAGANQNRVVGMNLNPRAGQRGVERIPGTGGLDGFFRSDGADDAEADQQSASGFD